VRSRITLGLAWVAATALSILIAGAAVGTVRNNVTDRPSRLAQFELVASQPSSPSGDQPSEPVAPADAGPTGELIAPATTTTTTSPEISTPTTPAPPSQSATTAPPPATTTGAVPEWQLTTYETAGGWVRFRYSATAVELDAFGPAPGYRADVEKSGPSEVKVEFEGGDEREYSISAKIDGGRLSVEIEPDG
jgi:hypothetical protein